VSSATDLGLAQAAEHMPHADRIGARLGARLGLGDGDLATRYGVSILTSVGCPAYGNEVAMRAMQQGVVDTGTIALAERSPST
jgi:hypothetical protein